VPPAAPPSPGPNRLLVAAIAGGCLLSGGAIWLLDSRDNLWCGPLIRTGLVMGALWLALPTKGRAAAWANVSWIWVVLIAGALFLMVKRPLVLVPIFLGLLVLSAFAGTSSNKK